MSQERECLLELLRNALWGCPVCDTSPNVINRVLCLAEEQTVFALVFDAISKLDIKINQNILFESIGMVQTIQQQNQVIDRVLADFVCTIEKQGVEYLVVKGQTIAQLYPNPVLRMSGDIDYLIKDDYHQVKTKIEKAQSIELPSKLLEKEIAYNWKDVVFELHTSLIDLWNKKHQKYWDRIVLDNWNDRIQLKIDGATVYTLPPTLNAIYLFLHLFSHFSKVGISLRQLCDWAVYLRYYDKEIDKDRVQGILKELGLQKAYAAFGAVLVDKLGLPEASFPMKIADSHRKWTSKILDDVFRGGNFGRMNHKSKHPWLFKLESVGFALRNTVRYFKLAPSEMGMMIPKMIALNIKLVLG